MTSLRTFVAEVLDTQGAMIDLVDPDGLDVIAPDSLRATFGWPELARLGFGPQMPAGTLPIGLEGDWLDRFGALLGEHGRFAERQLVADAAAPPPADPTAMINHALELPNAVWRLAGSAPAWTRLLLLTFRTTAISDEKREGLVTIGLNCATGAVLGPELLDRLSAALDTAAAWTAPDPAASRAAGPAWDPATLATKIRPLIEHRVRADLDPFVAAMRRRLERDRTRVHAYHDDLRRAAFGKLAAARRSSGDKAQASAKREALRITAIERDYAAKLADLGHNYALKVTVDWVQGLSVLAPVQRFGLVIKRRKGERTLAMDWHPAARLLEPPACDWGLGLGAARVVCDERLHLVEVAGAGACGGCGKAYCRACCDGKCPKCGRG